MSAELQIMNALREAGATGGVLFDAAGRVLAHTMPSFFPMASLASAGERIVIFCETVSENFEPVADVVLTFDGQVLLIRRSQERILAVVFGEGANREAVKMATNLVFRRLSSSNAPATPRSAQGVPPEATSSAGDMTVRLPAPPRPMTPPPTTSTKPRPPPEPKPSAPKSPKKKSDIWGD